MASLFARGAARSLVQKNAGSLKRFFGGHVDMTKEFVPPKVANWHTQGGKICTFVACFWFFYRCQVDGPALIGLEHPFEEDGHGHDDHGHHEPVFGGNLGAVLDDGSPEECIAAIDALDAQGWGGAARSTLGASHLFEEGKSLGGAPTAKSQDA